jgi:hypothetical protein
MPPSRVLEAWGHHLQAILASFDEWRLITCCHLMNSLQIDTYGEVFLRVGFSLATATEEAPNRMVQ